MEMKFLPSLIVLWAFLESMLGVLIYTYLYMQSMKWFQNYEYFKHRSRVLI